MTCVRLQLHKNNHGPVQLKAVILLVQLPQRTAAARVGITVFPEEHQNHAALFRCK